MNSTADGPTAKEGKSAQRDEKFVGNGRGKMVLKKWYLE